MPQDKDKAISAQQMTVVKICQEEKYLEYYSRMNREQENHKAELSDMNPDDVEKVYHFCIVKVWRLLSKRKSKNSTNPLMIP